MRHTAPRPFTRAGTLKKIALSILCCTAAVAAPTQKPTAPPAADVAAIKSRLTLFADAKKHFIAMVMTSASDSPIFWSDDGKSFYRLRVTGGASSGEDDALERLARNFWEPRSPGSGEAGLDYSSDTKRLDVQCAGRHTPLTRLDGDATAKLLADARFYEPRWNRYAYALARDDRGRYFYVDNVRLPEGTKSFRLFAGPKGALVLQRMLNVVSDSQGDIFSTAHGELRLILGKQESTWIAHDKPQRLVWVPVDDNHVMIYTELGVYDGAQLGTPCDAL